VPKVIGALAGLPGIIEADAFYPGKEARVIYDPKLIAVEGIVQSLSQAGYFAAPKDPGERPPAFPTLIGRQPAPFRPDELVCYCFGYSRKDIETDFILHHRSLILEKIAAEKKAGGCDCANKNPKGR
jgi:copper chaperone CopZ